MQMFTKSELLMTHFHFSNENVLQKIENVGSSVLRSYSIFYSVSSVCVHSRFQALVQYLFIFEIIPEKLDLIIRFREKTAKI